jgi:Zn-dependent M28 family amino/carboxypeptidase
MPFLAIGILAALMMLTVPANARISLAAESNAATVASVSGDRMIGTVDALAEFGTRVFYTNSSVNSSAYIHDRFADLGLWVYYQDFQVAGFPVRNVVAVMNGSNPNEPQFLFGAHYDSASSSFMNYSVGGTVPAPGADDDASGVAAVLELATTLENRHFMNTVKFVAFAAEESGLNGSSYFVDQEHANGVNYSNTAIMDMVGYRGDTSNEAMIFRDTPGNTLATSMISAVSIYDLNISITAISGYDMEYSDHASFWRIGYPSLLVIEQLDGVTPVNPYYHSPQDTPDRLSKDQIVETTKTVLGGFLDLVNPPGSKRASSAPIILGFAVIAVTAVGAVYLIRHLKVRQ